MVTLLFIPMMLLEDYDDESGLYYIRARYMNPETGTLTRYCLAENNSPKLTARTHLRRCLQST